MTSSLLAKDQAARRYRVQRRA